MRPAYAYAAAFVVSVGVAVAVVSWHAGVGGGDGPPKPPKPKIAISRETTYITEPLAEDGYIDYLAALNAIGAKGVTPQNNAAVPLYQAFGPKDVPKNRREHVARLLGIQPPPDDGKYFLDETSFVQRNWKEGHQQAAGEDWKAVEAAEAQFERARERPWSPDGFPLVAAWLKENEQALALIVAASHRERFFFPLFGSGDRPMVIEALLPMAQQARHAGRALVARAMLRLKAGEIDEAWGDVLACHRLARLIAQGPTIIEGLVGIAIEGVAAHADAAIAHHGGLSAERARRFAEDLRRLPPMPKMVDKIRTGERFMFLDAVSMMARRGAAEISRLAGGGSEASGLIAWLANSVGALAINWEEPLRMGNAWYDRFVEAFAKPTRAERNAALQQIEADVKHVARQARDFKGFLGELMTSSPRRSASRQVGRMLVALLLPAISSVAKAEDRGAVYGAFGQIALALAAYRAEHGEYPADLAQLVPKHLAAIPEDPFANAPLRYKRKGAGCLVYSVNVNGKDDDGASFSVNPDGDEGYRPDADDVAIFMPWPEKK